MTSVMARLQAQTETATASAASSTLADTASKSGHCARGSATGNPVPSPAAFHHLQQTQGRPLAQKPRCLVNVDLA
jgi:hypothetical protein